MKKILLDINPQSLTWISSGNASSVHKNVPGLVSSIVDVIQIKSWTSFTHFIFSMILPLSEFSLF